MARLKRLAVGGHPHHVALIGLAGVPVFRDDDDHRLFLKVLFEAARQEGVAVHAYSLLPDRVQLLATPPDGEALSRMMQAVGRRYVAAFNRRHGRAGTLWQGRFRAAPIEAATELLCCMRYVEQAPARAGLALHAAHYPWSSAAHHVGAAPAPVVTDHPAFWQLGNTPFERDAAYGRLLDEPLNPETLIRLERTVQRGWALGSGRFLAALAGAANRPVAARARGRPRKRPADDMSP